MQSWAWHRALRHLDEVLVLVCRLVCREWLHDVDGCGWTAACGDVSRMAEGRVVDELRLRVSCVCGSAWVRLMLMARVWREVNAHSRITGRTATWLASVCDERLPLLPCRFELQIDIPLGLDKVVLQALLDGFGPGHEVRSEIGMPECRTIKRLLDEEWVTESYRRYEERAGDCGFVVALRPGAMRRPDRSRSTKALEYVRVVSVLI